MAARSVGWPLVLVLVLAGCSAVPDRTPDPTPAPALSSAGTPSAAGVAARAAHTATTLSSGDLLVVGGCVVDGCTTATDSAVLLDRSGWQAVAATASPRDAHTATLLADGRVLVAGGFSAEGTPPLASVEVFSPASAGWTTVGSLAVGRGGHAAARLGDGRVLVAGGWVRSRTYTATTEIYDPAPASFSAGPPLPIAVDGLAAVTLLDGSVLVAGGQERPGLATDRAVLITPDGQSAAEVDPLTRPRFKHTMVLLPTGEVLVIGGTPDDRELLRSTEIYDPSTRSFRAGPDLVNGRYKLTGAAAALPDGRVVVAGGGAGIELVDPGSGTSVVLDGGALVSSSFSTVNVVHDAVVAIGGYDDQIRLTGTSAVIPISALPATG